MMKKYKINVCLIYFFLITLSIPNPIIIYPIIMIPRNCGDIAWLVELFDVEFKLDVGNESPGIIKDENIIDVPINAPPIINNAVKILDLMLNPIPYDRKKRSIEPPPKIIPLSFAERGKNPSELFSIAIAASAI